VRQGGGMQHQVNTEHALYHVCSTQRSGRLDGQHTLTSRSGSASPAATQSMCSTRSSPDTYSVTGCSTWDGRNGQRHAHTAGKRASTCVRISTHTKGTGVGGVRDNRVSATIWMEPIKGSSPSVWRLRWCADLQSCVHLEEVEVLLLVHQKLHRPRRPDTPTPVHNSRPGRDRYDHHRVHPSVPFIATITHG
jgi:hypothetical protein